MYSVPAERLTIKPRLSVLEHLPVHNRSELLHLASLTKCRPFSLWPLFYASPLVSHSSAAFAASARASVDASSLVDFELRVTFE